MKKCLKLFLMIVILLVGLCFTSDVYAATENYDAIKSKVKYEYKIEANSGEDITKQLDGYLEEAGDIATSSGYVMIYIPSGTYYLSDEDLIIRSYTYLVAESDTEIIKKSTQTTGTSMIRTQRTEILPQNITIYGGVWNGSNKAKQGFEINGAKNVTIQNVKVEKCYTNGIYFNNEATGNVYDCISKNNKGRGMALYNKSNVTLKNSEISYNKSHGIVISDSLLYANKNAKNVIKYNDWSGISATGSSTKIYLDKNTITYNGQNPKSTGSGNAGHGIGISEKAYANLTNNNIRSNKECGISVFDSGKAKITNNTISNNKRHGIGARKQTNLTLSNNTISGNSYNGFLLSDRSKATLNKDGIKSNSNFGLSVVDASEATLTSTTISSNKSSNISISVGNDKRNNAKVILKNSNVISSSKKNHGIAISGKTQLQITGKNNKINKNKRSGISSVGKKAKIVIKGKTTIDSNKQSGIYVEATTAEISNATISNNSKFGVMVDGKGSLTIKNCTIKNNKNYGINVEGSGTTAKIQNNKITNNSRAGIMIKSKSKVTTLYKNTLDKNGDVGISIKTSAKVNSIKKNTIKNHKKYAIYIKGAKKPKITGNKMSNKKTVYYKK